MEGKNSVTSPPSYPYYLFEKKVLYKKIVGMFHSIDQIFPLRCHFSNHNIIDSINGMTTKIVIGTVNVVISQY